MHHWTIMCVGFRVGVAKRSHFSEENAPRETRHKVSKCGTRECNHKCGPTGINFPHKKPDLSFLDIYIYTVNAQLNQPQCATRYASEPICHSNTTCRWNAKPLVEPFHPDGTMSRSSTSTIDIYIYIYIYIYIKTKIICREKPNSTRVPKK